jgi:hypothetical protein
MPVQALAKRVMAETLSEALTRPTLQQAAKEFVKAYGLQVGGETFEEGTQAISEMLSEEIALAASGIDSELTMREGFMRVIESALYGAAGSAILGGVGPGANLLIDLRRASNTERQTKVFEDLAANRKESKYANRNPVGYERFLASQAEGTTAETIYVDGLIAQQVLAQSGVPTAQLEEILPGIRERISEAVQTGGDVTIPTARFGARLANTDLGNALLPHMRLSPDAMSATEAQEFATRRQEVVREAEQILAQKQEADATFVQEAQQIHDRIRHQAIAAGQEPAVADVAASMYQAFVVTQAAEEKITPAQVESRRRRPLTIEQVGELSAVAPLEQADQFDQAGQRNIDTPEFKAWSNNAPVIANEQSEAQEFTTGTPVVVEALHGSTERGLRRFDVGRAVEVPGAIFFTSNPAVAEQYTYERAYGDIISDQPTGDVIRAYVAFANPMVYQPKGKVVDAIEMGRAIEQAKAAGHDGLIIKNIDDSIGMTGDMGDVYVTWNPTSIKSVDNRGTWSRTSPNIFEQAVLNEQMQRWLQSDVMIRPADPRWETARPFGQFPTVTAEGRPRFEGEVTQTSLAEIVPEGRMVFHETNLNSAKALMSRILEGPRRHAPFFVSDNIDLALGQAGRGYIIELDPQFSNGQQVDVAERKPGLAMTEAAGAGTELRIDKTLRQSLRSVIVPNQRGLEALRRVPGLSERLDFDNPTQTERGLQINLKVAAAPGVMEQAAVQPRLMAVHNLSADNLAFADRMGGLAVPSIGVITEERGGVEGFGEITLIGTRDMADPATSRVFSSDAYSARFPRAEWPKVAYAKANKFVDQLRAVAARFEDRRIIEETFDAMVNSPDAQKVVNYWMRSMPVMALFLSEKGVDIAPIMRERNTLSRLAWEAIDKLRPAYEAVDQQLAYDEMEASPEYRNLQEQYAEAVRTQYAAVKDDLGESIVEELATQFTPTTLQRLSRDMSQADRQTIDYTATRSAIDAAMEPFIAEFKSWVDAKVLGQFKEPFLRVGRARKPYTLANIVDVMTSPKVRGEENGMTFGAGAARAEAATEFVDIEDMREAAKSSVVDPDEYSKAAKKSEAQLSAYRDAVIEYTTLTDWRGKSDTWAALDGSMRALATYGTRKRKDVTAMSRALAKEGFASNRMPVELIQQAIDAAEALFNAPVPYFEAKPQRAVGLGEFAGAVIPSDANQQVRDILDRNGLAYMTYIAGDETDRQRAVRQMAQSPEARGETLFQVMPAAGPARGGFDPRRVAIMLTRATDRTTMWHELVHFFLNEYTEMVADGSATARTRNDLDLLLKWFKIEGDTADARFAKWVSMSLEEQRKHHEALTYNAEIYAFEGKAPSAELVPVFERLRAFMLRVYKSIRDDLNTIYRREFGEDLPILTGEVRQVMDRMLATDEQIKRQAAINEMKPQFQTQEQSGMDDAEWAAYQAMQQEAIEASVTDMNKASMRQLQWLGNARSRILRDMQKKHDAKRKEVASEVAAELRVEPVYRAMTYLRTGKFIDSDGAEVTVEGPHRLDTKRTQAIYAGLPTEKAMEAVRATGMAMPKVFAPDIAKLGTGKYGMLGVDGLDPDVVAETFGFGSGDQMIRALLEAKPIKEAVAERTDAEMLRRYGDMNTPEAQEAEVQKALHNEARARFVAVELRHVARATEPVRVMLEAAKQVARELIVGMTLREVRPADFIAAEARAARDAGRMGATVNPEAVGRAAYTRTYNERIAAGADEATAVAEATTAATEAARKAQERSDALKAQYGADPQQALIRAKRAQLYQNQLAAEALRVREEVAKQVKYLRRILRDTNVKAMGAQAADQIAALLERFEVAPVSLKRLDERKALATWLAEQEAAGLVPDIAPEVADEARRVNYQQLTVAEFRDLADAIRQIEFIGKNERKVQLAAERAAYEEKRDEIVTRIRAVGRLRGVKFDPRSPLTNIGRSAAALRGFAAQHLKAASVARILDGGEDDGPLWTFAIRSANAAADMETRMRAEASAKLAEILAPVFALGNMGGKGVFFPSINRSLNREARLAIAMNVGNDGNRQRLLDGEGWTMEQIQPILESLTEAEWNAVQQVWDYIDTYRPLIAEKERRLYGKEPEWVKATPFTTRTADGREVRLEGGYYPIKYDPIASDRVATVDEAAEAKRALDGAYTAATTRRSFVKSRVREVVGRPLLYTLDAAFGGVNDVIHDLAWHEWLIQTQRLLRDPEFANAVRETRGPEYLKQLRDWTKDNAAGERKIGVAGEAALSWLRQGISASGLGFNVVSAAMQVTGFNQSIVRLGAKYVGRGVAQFAASPIDTARMVADKSSFMAERGRTQFREINEIRNRVRGQTEVARRVTAGTYFLMMNMQRTVDIPTWLAGYQKALDAGKDDATAVALADQVVRDTQGSGLISDLAAIERGGPVMKLFTVFYSYMNTVYNMTAVQTMTARSKGKLAADYAMLLVVPVVLGQAIKNLIQPDAGDDELDPEALARKLAAEELSFLMGTMVIAREFGGAAQLLTGAEGVRMGYGGPAGLRAVGEVYGLATQAGQLEFDRAFRRSAINTLGAFTGLPSAQVNRTIDGIEAVIEGEVEGVGAVVAPLTGVQR